MKMIRMEVLAKDEVELIHSSTLELLENIGIMVDSPEARALLKKKEQLWMIMAKACGLNFQKSSLKSN